ncbi:hypothetical protein HBA55_29760 [Pseudomaricurvus alkylphenolicus]|uniref:hypothetical protein n=1 Tax=Pseudomaricurvus alkylphenolicus TaxID=1306991 RepID=UPI0014203341|nr:hypothetical protein [Pseudomaricurvus alkylphenolicus]NIB43826.1 hypothetical protein [Pseudomaricurvus alkylphenolicus]
MRVLIILTILGLSGLAIGNGWGILGILGIAAIVALVATDKGGRSIDGFFAACFAFIIIGGAFGVVHYFLTP